MSESVQQAVLDFANNIPVDLNPYAEVAGFLIHLLQPPPTPTWARWLERGFLVGFVIIFLQSCFLIYMWIKTKKFRAFSIDELGLLNIDVRVVGIGYIAYSGLVITDIILNEILGGDYYFVGSQIMLFGCKFLVVLSCSWVFLWACVCQCASLKWKSSSHGRSFGHNMPKIIPWIMHMSLIILIIWPIPIVFWEYGSACAEYNQILVIVLTVVKSLRKSAATVTPATYNKFQLLLALIPAQQVEPLLDAVAHSVRSGILAYLVAMGILCLAYFPFLIYSLLGLHSRGVSEAYYVETLVDASEAELLKFREMTNQTRREWNLVMLHAIIAYAGTLAHIPTIIWQMTIKGNSFLRNETWMLTTRLGLHGPFAVVGIVSLFFLNRNVGLRLHGSEEEPDMASSSIEPGEEFTGRETTSSAEPQRFDNSTYFEKRSSFGESEFIKNHQEMTTHHTHLRPKSRTYVTMSQQITRSSDTYRARPSGRSVSTDSTATINMHVISP